VSRLPIRRRETAITGRDIGQAERAASKADLATFKYALKSREEAEQDRLDSQAMADALRASLDEEIDLLDYGLRRAGGSPVKAELVARKLDMLSATNNRRISRRFGA
jgi:uncharacterized protein YicC (UPF0701 family)